MDVDRKRNFRALKFRTTHEFKGSRQKDKQKASKKESSSAAPNPNLDRGDASDALKKKIRMFENGERPGDEHATTVICEIGAMKALVSGAACLTCGKCGPAVQELAAKGKELASFLELCCHNDACPTSVLLSIYSSRHASAAENVSGVVKAVVAACTIRVGHKQLSWFCVLLDLPKPMHHKTFAGITKIVHLAVTKAAAMNLELTRKMIAEEKKRGHKSHNGVGTAISVYTRLCLDTEVLSNYCLSCSRRKAFKDEGEEKVSQVFHKLVCEKNTDGSSHAMETEAAMRIWQRTSSCATPLQFPTFLSEGDSKAYAAVSEANSVGLRPFDFSTGLRKLKTPLPWGQKLKGGTNQKLQSSFRSPSPQVLQELGIPPSQEPITLSNKCDKKRISSMTTKGTAEARSHRRRMLLQSNSLKGCKSARTFVSTTSLTLRRLSSLRSKAQRCLHCSQFTGGP
ncbi:hypothetical protein HPB47_017559 [Ixodes persulcatus]|uniref:Uncharacterized protein n=1 Tax=Ixodes persulcatus TaxID=34615 RepID=A0AC60QRJ6_IXOPE|nr:hypothetical protein HPB47_017559 [Ixodes persulcatus]